MVKRIAFIRKTFDSFNFLQIILITGGKIQKIRMLFFLCTFFPLKHFLSYFRPPAQKLELKWRFSKVRKNILFIRNIQTFETFIKCCEIYNLFYLTNREPESAATKKFEIYSFTYKFSILIFFKLQNGNLYLILSNFSRAIN